MTEWNNGWATDTLPLMRLSEDALNSCKNELDDFARELLNRHSKQQVETLFNTIYYIYIAQNIREEGVASLNVPQDCLRALETMGLVEASQWGSLKNFRSFRLTKKGNSIARILVKDTLAKIDPADFAGINPFTLIYVLNNKKIERSLNSYNISSSLGKPYLLHQISKTFLNDCVDAMELFEEKCLAVRANNYVSTRGGEPRKETYLLLPDLTIEHFGDIFGTTDYSELVRSYNELHDKWVRLVIRNHILKDFLDESLIDAHDIQKINEVYDNELIDLLEEIERSGPIVLQNEVKSGQLPANPLQLYIPDKRKFLQKVRELYQNNKREIEELCQVIEHFPRQVIEHFPQELPSYEEKERGNKMGKGGTAPDESEGIQPTSPILKDAIILGSNDMPLQYGVIGRCDGKNVLIDLNSPHTIVVLGMMGAGKGYTIGVISEMLVGGAIENISNVSKKATIIVLYKPDNDDLPSEFSSIRYPNDVQKEIEGLEEYATQPIALIDESQFRVFVDPTVYTRNLEAFKKDYNTENIFPISIDPSTLDGEDWKTALLISAGEEAIYHRVILNIIKDLDNISLEEITLRVNESAELTDLQKKFARGRLEIFKSYLKQDNLINNLAIGGVNIIDLRKAHYYMPSDLLSIITLIIRRLQRKDKFKDEPFVFVMNEAHLYLKRGRESKDFASVIEKLIRLKRHTGNWLLLDTHLMDDVEPEVIELADIMFIHQFNKAVNSPVINRVLKESDYKLDQLKPGEAIAYATTSSLHPSVPIRVKIRPRVSKHGGATKTTIKDDN